MYSDVSQSLHFSSECGVNLSQILAVLVELGDPLLKFFILQVIQPLPLLKGAARHSKQQINDCMF